MHGNPSSQTTWNQSQTRTCSIAKINELSTSPQQIKNARRRCIKKLGRYSWGDLGYSWGDLGYFWVACQLYEKLEKFGSHDIKMNERTYWSQVVKRKFSTELSNVGSMSDVDSIQVVVFVIIRPTKVTKMIRLEVCPRYTRVSAIFVQSVVDIARLQTNTQDSTFRAKLCPFVGNETNSVHSTYFSTEGLCSKRRIFYHLQEVESRTFVAF